MCVCVCSVLAAVCLVLLHLGKRSRVGLGPRFGLKPQTFICLYYNDYLGTET